MKPKYNHSWELDEPQAIQLQDDLAKKVVQSDLIDEVKLIAGVDVAYSKEDNRLVAGVVVLDANSLQIVEQVHVEDVPHFPYIPGLFSFRELPPIIKAFEKLKNTPDLIICDGQGIAHPRRFGLASHLGVLFDLPTIGCGKTKLIGEANPPGDQRGENSPLVDQGEVIGMVLRTQNKTNPVYISIGHRISLETACKWVLKLSPKYRLPETTRGADQLVNQVLANRSATRT